MPKSFPIPVDAVGEAALLCYQAQGKEFSKATVCILKELHIAFKSRNHPACRALIGELRARQDFK